MKLKNTTLSIIIFAAVQVFSQDFNCGDSKYGPVLGGIDLVNIVDSYTFLDKAVLPQFGISNYSYSLKNFDEKGEILSDYTFLFINETNLNAFKNAVESGNEKYLPAYGGFCGWAMTGDDLHLSRKEPPHFGTGPACITNQYTHSIIHDRLVFFLGEDPKNLFEYNDVQTAKHKHSADTNFLFFTEYNRKNFTMDNNSTFYCFNTETLACQQGVPFTGI